jgi:hypothetical protein
MQNNFENDEENEEDLLEAICENGEPVFSMFWDSGGPEAGADCEYEHANRTPLAKSRGERGSVRKRNHVGAPAGGRRQSEIGGKI